jgi:acyl carrier protein
VTTSSVIDFIISVLIDKYGFVEEDLPLDADLEELDFDSLALAELAGALSRVYGISVADDDLDKAGSLAGIAALVDERLATADGLV